jgi:hypothetical protein
LLTVKLTRHEALEAAVDGCKRQLESISEGRKDTYGEPGHPWEAHIEGAMAEMAFAKALNLFWGPSVGRFHNDKGDVAGWEVRWTPHKSGHLLVYDRDRDEAPYVLVVGRFPLYKVAGHILGRDAKRDEYHNPKARGKRCFWIPQADLTALRGDEGRWEPSESRCTAA